MKLTRKFGRRISRAMLLVFFMAIIWPAPAKAMDPPACPAGCACDSLGADSDTQLILTCKPAPGSFNGILVVYAHGYVSPDEPLALPLVEIGEFIPIIDLILNAGFAFATSSYSKNGYAIEQAGNDLNALVAHFKDNVAPPEKPVQKVLITGASEGGIIATMLVEKFPDIYAGGLALCGPVGGMPYQIQYLGDFRVVFDYFFDGVIPLDSIYDPNTVSLEDWEDIKADIEDVIADEPGQTRQLFNVTGAAADPADPAQSAIDLLKFSVLGANDMLDTADGRPYGNRLKWYRGSDNDFALNFGVERVRSDFTGRQYIRNYYDTTGKLVRPLVTLHTTGDDAVPFKHEVIYKLKVALQGRSHRLVSIPVFREGHCAFEAQEVLGAFVLLLLMTLS